MPIHSSCGCSDAPMLLRPAAQVARVARHTPEIARVLSHTPELLRISRHMPEFLRVFRHVPEFFRFLRHTPELFRLWRVARIAHGAAAAMELQHVREAEEQRHLLAQLQKVRWGGCSVVGQAVRVRGC